MKTVLVGFSVNPEIVLRLRKPDFGQKGFLDFLEITPSGSSANVAMCLRNMGVMSNLIVPIEIKNSDFSELMQIAMKKIPLQHTTVSILKNGPCAVYPIYGSDIPEIIHGKKGTMDDEYPVVEVMKEFIDYDYKVLTGVTENFYSVSKYLFENSKEGSRFLSPHHTFCHGDVLDKLVDLLKYTDFFILNKSEFNKTGFSFEFIHSLGVTLIIVTDEKNGGSFSLKDKGEGKYDAEIVNGPVYTIGSGDWFNGAFTSLLVKNNIFVDDELSIEIVKEGCNFGATVSAKKILVEGGINGPLLKDL